MYIVTLAGRSNTAVTQLTAPLFYNLSESDVHAWNIRVPYDSFVFSSRSLECRLSSDEG